MEETLIEKLQAGRQRRKTPRRIKAIETEFLFVKFRSRLEARWAVFFQALGLLWNYEPEGYETSHGWYLPDFSVENWLVEVKPSGVREDEHSDAVLRLAEVAYKTEQPCLLITGPPRLDAHHCDLIDGSEEANGNASLACCWFASCRRCEGVGLLFPGGSCEDEKIKHHETGHIWWEIGPHTCGDHERPGLGIGRRLEAAFSLASSERFQRHR